MIEGFVSRAMTRDYRSSSWTQVPYFGETYFTISWLNPKGGESWIEALKVGGTGIVWIYNKWKNGFKNKKAQGLAHPAQVYELCCGRYIRTMRNLLGIVYSFLRIAKGVR
jgi:hypothetical protein